MYDPIKDGHEKNREDVSYIEAQPPKALNDIVHSYWQLKSDIPLKSDFTLHAIPDACTNILLNQYEPDIAGVTALNTTYTELNLGMDFHYAGIQFFPGVWRGNCLETKDSFVGSKYEGDLPLKEVNWQTANLSFSDKQPVFTNLVLRLIEGGIVQRNAVTHKILSNLDHIHAVSDMAALTHMSTRQLQRVLKQTTGFSPHDFLKVMRLQKSLAQQHRDLYSDQSHFIRSFKSITGYTPKEYYLKYDV